MAGLITLVAMVFIAQSQEMEKPEPVPPIRKAGILENAWYEKQAKLWLNEIVKDRKNETAWYNFAMATDYAFIGRPDKADYRKSTRLDLLGKMRDAIPGTVTFHYFDKRFGNGGVAALEKAHEIDPDNPLPYTGLIGSYELEGNSEKTKYFLQRLHDSRDFPAAIIEFNYNMLMSTDKNAVLFTNGDNDTFSSWMLQQVRDIRTDVMVLNLHLSMGNPDYLLRKLNEKGLSIEAAELPKSTSPTFAREICELITGKSSAIPVYFALTVDGPVLDSFRDSLFIVGLTQRYRPKRYNNLPELRRNLEERFRLDYLDYDWTMVNDPSQHLIEKQLNVNYIVPSLMLYEDYASQQNRSRAEHWKRFAHKIAETAGLTEQMDHYLSYVHDKLKAR